MNRTNSVIVRDMTSPNFTNKTVGIYIGCILQAVVGR